MSWLSHRFAWPSPRNNAVRHAGLVLLHSTTPAVAWCSSPRRRTEHSVATGCLSITHQDLDHKGLVLGAVGIHLNAHAAVMQQQARHFLPAGGALSQWQYTLPSLCSEAPPDGPVRAESPKCHACPEDMLIRSRRQTAASVLKSALTPCSCACNCQACFSGSVASSCTSASW